MILFSFTPEDFFSAFTGYKLVNGKIEPGNPDLPALMACQAFANRANAKLEAHLKTLPKVRRLKNGMIVSSNPVPGIEVNFTGGVEVTHEGLLWGVKEIEK